MSKLQPVRLNPEAGHIRTNPETPGRLTRAAEPKERFTREFKLDRAEINEQERTVPLAFSSEEPVERWGENEVLSHADGDYDFSRLNDSHPLLLGHNEYDPTTQIGVVEPGSAKVSGKVGRCVVRFSKSPLGEEIFQDVKDGIRKLVSVGYDRNGVVKSEKAKDGMVTTRYKWMPTHVAIVPVPADHKKAGIGRNKDDGKIDFSKVTETDIANLSIEQKQRMKLLLDPNPAGGGGAAATAPAVTVNESEVRTKALSAERGRVKEISAIADQLIKDHPQCADKIRGMTNEAISQETAVADYQIRAMKEVLGAKPVKPVTMEALGMNEREQSSYSILRGIQSCLRRDTRTPDGLEGDVHSAMTKSVVSSGIQSEGFLVPHDARVRHGNNRAYRRSEAYQRDLQVSVFNQGGATVATVIETPIIELLRNRLVTSALGITTMGGLSSNVSIPRQTGAATAYALPESATLTKSTQALDQILLAPHRVGAWNDYTRQLLLQSSIDVENFIRDDLMKVLALKWDLLILNGQGAGSEPLGILNTPGIGSVLFGGSATFSLLVAFETALAVLNADAGNMAYATTPSVRGTLKSAAKLLKGATTVAAVALWDGGEAPGEGEVNGYRALASNQIPNNQVLFGNWSEVVHGLYGGYDVIVNPYSRDTDAAVRITINSFGDVALRHAASFCASADAGNQ